jgi:hypothetical protein
MYNHTYQNLIEYCFGLAVYNPMLVCFDGYFCLTTSDTIPIKDNAIQCIL